MSRCLPLLLTLAPLAFAQPAARDLTLPELVAAAAQDVAKLPPDAQCVARYLTLSNIPPAERETFYLALSGHVQHLSRAPDLPKPAIVAGTFGALVRVFLDDYHWKRATWEKLADADPFYHVTLEIEEVAGPWTLWPGGRWRDGREYARGSFQYQPKQKVRKTALAPHLNDGTKASQDALAALVSLTQSAAPILRADWFLNQTAAQHNRAVGYYDFIGVKTEADFQRLIGFSEKDRFRPQLRDAIALSGVTTQPRAIRRDDSQGGAYWRSFDFQLAKDKKNPLRVIGDDIEREADASEQYGTLPNNFWGTFLRNGAGVRQDFAPAEIASNHFSPTNDKLVHINIACYECHTKGGLQDLDAWHRAAAAAPLEFRFIDRQAAIDYRQQYARRLEPYFDRDRKLFAEAVKEVTGWTPERYAREYAGAWRRYEDARVDLAWAAADLGVAKDRLARAIDAQVRTGQADPVAGRLLLMTFGIRQYEEIYPTLQAYLSGTK